MAFHELRPSWEMAKNRYAETIANVRQEQLAWRLLPGTNSVGFLLRHISEVEYYFASIFFNRPVPDGISFSTLGPVKDDGRHTDLASLLTFAKDASAHLLDAMENLPAEKWEIPVESFKGPLTPRQVLGLLIYHTGHHGGQIGLILKYGSNQ